MTCLFEWKAKCMNVYFKQNVFERKERKRQYPSFSVSIDWCNEYSKDGAWLTKATRRRRKKRKEKKYLFRDKGRRYWIRKEIFFWFNEINYFRCIYTHQNGRKDVCVRRNSWGRFKYDRRHDHNHAKIDQNKRWKNEENFRLAFNELKSTMMKILEEWIHTTFTSMICDGSRYWSILLSSCCIS